MPPSYGVSAANFILNKMVNIKSMVVRQSLGTRKTALPLKGEVFLVTTLELVWELFSL
jgi:hypothetical protein